MSIKTRLLAVCLLVLFLTVTVLSGALFTLYNQSYERQTYQNKQQTIEQLALNIEGYFDDLNRLILTTISNTYLMEQLTAPAPETELEKLEKRRVVEAFLDDIMITPRKDILNVFILADDIYHGGRYPSSVDAEADYKSLPWYKEALRTGRRVFVPAHLEELLTDPKYTVFSFARAFQNPNSLKDAGVIKVDANTSGIQSICEEVDTGETGGLIVRDESGAVLLNTFPPDVNLEAFLQVDPQTEEYLLTVAEEEYIFNTTTIENFHWTVLSFHSTEEFNSLQDQQLLLTVAIAAGCGFLTLLVLLLFTSSFLRPLLGIVDLMKKAEGGDMTVQYTEARRDEIGYLGRSFNDMLERITEANRLNTQLITEVYEARALQNKARLHALQAQIKPHFMCNTLNMISMMIQSGQQEEAVKNIHLLSTMMRGLTKFDTLIPLRQELVLLRAYLDLQLGRYADRLVYHETVSTAYYDYLFPALLLQPIVENSIVHGCENNPGVSTLLITSKASDALYLIVSDDAGGMGEEELAALRQKLREAGENRTGNPEAYSADHGLGLVNIHQRIRIYYGESYGLTVDSRPGEGTSVTLRLPLDGPRQNMEKEADK